MFKQFKSAKVLTLLAVAGIGALYAAPPSGGSASGSAPLQNGAPNTAVYFATDDAYNSVANSTSSVVTAPTVMAVQTAKIMGLVSAVAAEAAEAMRGGGNVADSSGGVKLAGSSGSQHRASAWVRASHGAIDNAVKNQEWNGHSYLMMIGADYRFNNMFCAGLGLSYSRLDARTEFNKGTVTQDTFGVNPYLVIVPHKNFNLEVVAGANWSNEKGDRRYFVENAGGDGRRTIDNKFSSSAKGTTTFGGIFANFINTAGKANYGLQVGYLMAQKKLNAHNETSASSEFAYMAKKTPSNTFKVGTVSGKVKAGYQLTPSVSPYVTLHAQYDAQRNEGVKYANGKSYEVSRSAFGGGTGVSYRGDDAMSGSLEFDYTQRNKLKMYVTGIRLHYGF
jgi:hypothetical protein